MKKIYWICEECGTDNPSDVTICPVCGHEASAHELMSAQEEDNTPPVSNDYAPRQEPIQESQGHVDVEPAYKDEPFLVFTHPRKETEEVEEDVVPEVVEEKKEDVPEDVVEIDFDGIAKHNPFDDLGKNAGTELAFMRYFHDPDVLHICDLVTNAMFALAWLSLLFGIYTFIMNGQMSVLYTILTHFIDSMVNIVKNGYGYFFNFRASNNVILSLGSLLFRNFINLVNIIIENIAQLVGYFTGLFGL